ncbi:hypothetical protein BD779DRAFT_997645 [Infundibulicybe gibba]|nr:hypothetical protein BD779DRAFT_997645 [Infundibulicybe gibba]
MLPPEMHPKIVLLLTQSLGMSSLEILNPETPLAFLPKQDADRYEVSRHIYLATLGAFIWDILTHLPEEYRLLSKSRLALPTMAYFFSRVASLAYIITSVVFQISTVRSCQALQVAIGWCYCAAVSSSSFLFFFRVRALFERRLIVVVFFFISWLAVLGGTMIVPFSITGGHIGNTQYCINTSVKPVNSAAVAISSFNDALVLAAVSWRIIVSMSLEESFRGRLRTLIGRGSLPTLSKAVLQSGQQYYFITVGSNILTLVMILIPGIPPVYHAMFTVPNVVLMNSMACRVYRQIKFGHILAIHTVYSVGASTVPRISTHRASSMSTSAPDNGVRSLVGGIEITKAVDVVCDIPMEVVLHNDVKGQIPFGELA